MRASALTLAALCVLAAAAVRGDDKKDGPVKITPDELIAVQTKQEPPEAEARKRWAGKTAEFSGTFWASVQELKDGDHKGEYLFSFRIDEKNPKSPLLAAYFKDPEDVATLKSRKVTAPAPFKYRGKVVIDYGVVWRIWLEDAELVKE
jgi:hypothetical protein